MSIKSFRDLDVYKSAYWAAVTIVKDVVTCLPDQEKYDLANQLRRSSKAIPALIAEGFAKKHQLKGFQKYLIDSIGECNETIVHLSYCIDIYGGYIDQELCQDLIARYEVVCKQLYKLNIAWQNFKKYEH